MSSKNNPADLLDELAVEAQFKGMVDSCNQSKPKLAPGETVINLGAAKRELLKRLTSDDAANVRWPR